MIRRNSSGDESSIVIAQGEEAGDNNRRSSSNIGVARKTGKRKRSAEYKVSNSKDLQAKLPSDFELGDFDVPCNRGKWALTSPGNVWYRALIFDRLEEYSAAETKQKKSAIVSNIVDAVKKKSPQGGFVRSVDHIWYNVTDHIAREKTGQCFRDMLHEKYRSSTKAKRHRRQNLKAAEEKMLKKRATKNSPEMGLEGKSGPQFSTVPGGVLPTTNIYPDFHTSFPSSIDPQSSIDSPQLCQPFGISQAGHLPMNLPQFQTQQLHALFQEQQAFFQRQLVEQQQNQLLWNQQAWGHQQAFGFQYSSQGHVPYFPLRQSGVMQSAGAADTGTAEAVTTRGGVDDKNAKAEERMEPIPLEHFPSLKMAPVETSSDTVKSLCVNSEHGSPQQQHSFQAKEPLHSPDHNHEFNNHNHGSPHHQLPNQGQLLDPIPLHEAEQHSTFLGHAAVDEETTSCFVQHILGGAGDCDTAVQNSNDTSHDDDK